MRGAVWRLKKTKDIARKSREFPGMPQSGRKFTNGGAFPQVPAGDTGGETGGGAAERKRAGGPGEREGGIWGMRYIGDA